MMKKIVHILFFLLLIAILGVGIFYYLDYRKYAPQREDYKRIATEDFTSVFFSTFPIDNYTEEAFAYYRDIYPLKASYCIPDTATLDEYFLNVSGTLNEVSSAYLGVRPDIITAEDVIRLARSYQDMQFEIIISYPSMNYWTKLKEEEYPVVLQAYQDCVNTLMEAREEDEWLKGNLSVYFFNTAEWLVGNPSHYTNDFNVNEGIARLLFTYMDDGHGYQLSEENYEETLENFAELVETYRAEPPEYPDLSKWDIVFFGDSVIAFDDTTSIPDALAGLTGAHVYNCAQGGSCAASAPGDTSGITNISGVVDAFLAKDLSNIDENSLMYHGMKDCQKKSKKNRTKCFVLSFGLNDYYSGQRVQSEDPYDLSTYSGALRSAVEKLQDAYPEAFILLMTPNFTSYFGNGLQAQSDAGGLLPDYVSAAISLSDELDTLLFDSYTRLGVNAANHTDYLMDGTHPNEATRYQMARYLAELLQKQLPEPKNSNS